MEFREDKPVDPEKQDSLQQWRDILNTPWEEDERDKPAEARYNFREDARQYRIETHCSINEDDSGTYHPGRGLKCFAAAPRVLTKRRVNTKDDNNEGSKRPRSLRRSLKQQQLEAGAQASEAAQMLLKLRAKMAGVNGTGTSKSIHNPASTAGMKTNTDVSIVVASAGEPSDDFAIEIQLEGSGVQGHRSGHYTYKIANLLVNIMEDPETYAPVVEVLASGLPNKIHSYKTRTSEDTDERLMGFGPLERQREKATKFEKGKGRESQVVSHARLHNRVVFATRLPHPLKFEADWCNWCADIYSGLLGAEAVDEIELDRGHGKGLVTNETPITLGSNMCSSCVLPRLQILQCSKHQMEPMKNVQTQDMTDLLVTREMARAHLEWCSICTSLSATLACKVCRLKLCIQCGSELEKEYAGDLNNLIIGLKNTLLEDPFLLRADAELLHQYGELARRLD